MNLRQISRLRTVKPLGQLADGLNKLNTLNTGPPGQKESAPQGWHALARRLTELRLLAEYHLHAGVQTAFAKPRTPTEGYAAIIGRLHLASLAHPEVPAVRS
jgi:hypothetical protein